MIGAFVANSLMMQAARSHGHHGDGLSKKEASRWLKAELEYRAAERERERKHQQVVQREFMEARMQIAQSEELTAEAERTGFGFTMRNDYSPKLRFHDDEPLGIYWNVGYGVEQDFRIYICSKNPIGDNEIDVVTNAFWFLTETEGKRKISTEDFARAIKIGGYATEPVSVREVNHHKDENLLTVLLS